jgi:hypothetical protein
LARTNPARLEGHAMLFVAISVFLTAIAVCVGSIVLSERKLVRQRPDLNKVFGDDDNGESQSPKR